MGILACDFPDRIRAIAINICMRLTDILNEDFYWGNEHDKNTFMSLKGLVNKNNGVFKSQAQQKFVLNNTLKHEPERDPAFCKSNFGVDVDESKGEKLVVLTATAQWANYGTRSMVPVYYGFVVDKYGVSSYWKIGAKGNYRDGSAPNAAKTKLEWKRPDDADTSHLELSDEQKADELAKKKKEFVVKMGGSFGNYIGNVGDKKYDFGDVEVVAVKDMGPGQYGNVTWHMFKDKNGDVIYYSGANLDVQKGDKKHLMGTIKRHQVSKRGDKVTVIGRPKFIVA